MNLKYRIAKKNEINIALRLLKEAAEWLDDKGIDYWQNWHNPNEEFSNWIKEGFNNQEFNFVELNNEIVGMYRLQYNDEMIWGEKEDKAGYVHSFTTRRNIKGKGIGKKILEHIEEELRSKSIDILRLDCGCNVTGLCEYYIRNGFIRVGETELPGEKLNLYEKKLKI